LPVKVDRRFSLTVYVLQALEEISQQYHVPLLHPIRTDGTVPRAERAREFLVDYDAKCKALEDYTTAASQLMELLNVIPEAEYHEEVLSA
jgi:cellulose biosynthesis protein BcsQ